jgi:hypothetical protein
MTRTTKTTTRKPTPNANKVNVNANKVKVNANKVGINAAKVRANSAKVAANAASVKANAAKAKVTPKAAATKAVAPKVKTATAVATPKYNTTRGKSFLIETNKKYDEYGTRAQADSAIRANRYTNPAMETFSPSGVRSQTSLITKQTKNLPDSGLNTKTGKMYKIDRSTLPDYKAPGNTGAGALRRTPEVKNATGWGDCGPGYRVDSQGNCVKK